MSDFDIRRQRHHRSGKFLGKAETYRPFRNKFGKYLLGDPKFGKRKHYKVHRVEVDTLEQAVDLIEKKGFSLWMKGDLTGQQNLIAAHRIEIERIDA